MNNTGGDQAQQTRAFPLGPDSFALFPGRDYRRALEGLGEDLRRGARLLCLVGPPGIGKSMLLRSLRVRLHRGWVGELAQPPLGGVLPRLADALGAGSGAAEPALLRRLQELRAAGRAERLPIIQIIDDAETLSRDDLTLLRRLFGAVQGQLLLVGQPPLLRLFDGASEPMPDGVYRLEPLAADEVGAYLRHRLNEAGLDRGLFDDEAVAAVAAYSGGVPRLINLLCFTTLADVDSTSDAPVTAARIHAAARHRAVHGGYPFLQPPPAARSEPPPEPENVAMVVGERREWQSEPRPHGYWRMAGVLMLGLALGIMAARVPSLHGFEGTSLARAAEELGAGADKALRGAETTLAEASRGLAAWLSPPPAPAAAVSESNAAVFETAPVPATPVAPPPAPVKPAPAALPKPAPSPPPADDGAMRLSPAERRHLAGLYADRAQYEMHAGRWIDARISILRGLSLMPDDADLQGLDRGLRALIAQRDPARAQPGAAQTPVSPPPADRPVKDKITHLYLERAEYEWRDGRLQDALVSVDSGLEEDPDNAALLAMRRRVMEEMAAPR